MEMKKVVEEELKKGWEATTQLRRRRRQQQQQLGNNNGGGKEEEIESDSKKMSIIINSFDTCISILQRYIQALDNNNSSQIISLREDAPNNAPVDSQSLGIQRQLKSKNPCVKRVETSNLESDGYLWRKYGRKPILNAKHPREYYRCTHRDDQQCPATKQVQMISKNNPTKFNIIYYSHHTCRPDFYSSNNIISHIQNIMLLDDHMMLHNNDYYSPKLNLICFDTKNPKQEVVLNPPAQQLHHHVLHASSSSSSSSPPSSSSYVVPARHAHIMTVRKELQDHTTLDGESQLQLQDHIPLWEDA